jgi:N-methylhydantoinase B
MLHTRVYKTKFRIAEVLIEVDMTDNPDSIPNGLNLSDGTALSAPMVGIFNSIDDNVPKNADSFRRINVLLRDGCVVGRPRHPTSCSVATTNAADGVANPVQRAFAEIADGLGRAETGALIPPSCSVICGSHDGEPCVNELFLGCTGGAGTPFADGWLTILHVGNAGMCYQDSIEIDELRHPIFVRSRRLIPDSEGAGALSRRARRLLGVFADAGRDVGGLCKRWKHQCSLGRTWRIDWSAVFTISPPFGRYAGSCGALR